MASDVDICNLALLHLGAEPITALTDGSAQAAVCNAVYPTLRDTYLASFPWAFATEKGTLLTADAANPPTEWHYRFKVPPGFLTLLRIHDTGWDIPFAFAADGYLFANQQSNVYVDYIRFVSEGEYPDHFVQAFGWHLAADICMGVTRDANLFQITTRQAERWDVRAKHIDSKQQYSRHFNVTGILGAR